MINTTEKNIILKQFFFRFVLVIIVFTYFSSLSFAAPAGTTGFNFLKIGIGPKAIGMGEAFVALSDDASAVYWNPAGLVQIEGKKVSLTNTVWFKGIQYQFISYTQPLYKLKGNIATSICYLSKSDIQGYDTHGNPTRKLHFSDICLIASYARETSILNGLLKKIHSKDQKMSIGTNIKIIKENLADESAMAYAVDLGTLIRIKNVELIHMLGESELNFGLNFQNIGFAQKFINEASPLPFNTKIGANYHSLDHDLTLCMDYNLPKDGNVHLNIGTEYWLYDLIALRIGFSSNEDSGSGLRWGIGVDGDRFMLDYAFSEFGILGNTHHMSINWRFGFWQRMAKVNYQIEKHFRLGKKYYQSGDIINAYQEFSNVLLFDPEHKESKEYLEKIEKQKARIKLDRQLDIAKQLFEQEKLIESKEKFESILELAPEHKESKEYLTRIEKKIEKMSEEEKLFIEGMLFYKKGEYTKAVSKWEKALILNPQNAEIRKYLPDAKKKMKQLIAEEKEKETEQIYKNGINLFNENKFEEAIGEWNKIIVSTPSYKDTVSYIEQAKNKLAEENYLDGKEFFEKEMYKEAIECFEKSLYFMPGHESSEKSMEKALNRLKGYNNKLADKYYDEGLEYYLNGNKEEAIKLWEKALEIYPEHSRTKSAIERMKKE